MKQMECTPEKEFEGQSIKSMQVGGNRRMTTALLIYLMELIVYKGSS